jgi:hypothetical protein
MPRPHLSVYPRYTVVAEKLETIASLGILNSRMKDYFDLWILAKHCNFDGAILAKAISATFERRDTSIPSAMPFGLTDEFAEDAKKVQQWQAFQRKNALEAMPLKTIVEDLRQFLQPVLKTIL